MTGSACYNGIVSIAFGYLNQSAYAKRLDLIIMNKPKTAIILGSILLAFFASKVFGEENKLIWVPIVTSIKGSRAEVSRQSNCDWPNVNLWVRFSYPDKNDKGYCGEIQEWWIDCNEQKGVTVTSRFYENTTLDIGGWNKLTHPDTPVYKDAVVEVCNKFKEGKI